MIRFLNGPTLGAELPKLCRTSDKVRIAVAFWGDGALEVLGLARPLDRAHIVCNLRSGGTNPKVIRELALSGAHVKQSNDLHAKLYLFDDHAVIGSSNLSANGLSLQGSEAAGWTEANILFDRGSGPYKDVESQFDDIWRCAKPIEEADLDIALEAWSQRRRVGLAGRISSASDLLSALSETPEIFADQRIFLIGDIDQLSPSSEEAIKVERERLNVGDELDCWEDWDAMPKSATFVAFMVGPRRGVRFDGFWHSPEIRREIRNKEGVTLQLVDHLDKVQGIKRVGDLARWREIIERQNTDADGRVMVELGQIAREYLAR